jgi:hypothetical protein
MLHAQDDAEHVGVEGGGIALGGLFGNRAGLAFGAGIVDRDVKPSKAGDGAIDQISDIVLMPDIGADEFGLGAGGAKLGGQGYTFFIAAAGDDNLGAIVGEGKGRGASDTCQAAGDQNDWIAHWIIFRKSGVAALVLDKI